MKSVCCHTLLFACTILVSLSPVRTSACSGLQDTDQLTFRMVYCGQGFLTSSNGYEASDGTHLYRRYATYHSEREARRALGRERKKLRDVEPTSVEGAIGERQNYQAFWGTSTDTDGAKVVVYLSIDGTSVERIEAASKRHIQVFRTAPYGSEASDQ